jgi:chromosome segregation ATPase
VAQDLVQGWLQDIAAYSERFRELQAQGRERLSRQIGQLRQSLKGLESEEAALKEHAEARIQELSRTRAEAVRDSIEKSIVDLGQRQKGIEENWLFANHAVRELESILENDGDLFAAYGRRIRRVLDASTEELETRIQGLIANLLLTDTQIKVALSGVPLREPIRAVLVPSPQVAQSITKRLGLPALIEGTIPLSGRHLFNKRPVIRLTLVAY